MYSESSKIIISKRVGWNYPVGSLFPIELSEENRIATSGRYVNSFHQLSSIENLHATISENLTSEIRFNEQLNSMRLQATSEILNKILDQHSSYDFDKNYDVIIEKHQSLFDEPLGYLLAIKCMEIFVSSNRSNAIERNSKLSYQLLKVELEGVKNESGITISHGLNAKLHSAIRKAQKKLFPEQILIIGGNEW